MSDTSFVIGVLFLLLCSVGGLLALSSRLASTVVEQVSPRRSRVVVKR